MGGSEEAGRGGGTKEEGKGQGEGEREGQVAPFSLEDVRDEDLFLINEDDWALKPLSLRGLVLLLRMLDEADDLWGALMELDEGTLADFLSLLIRRPVAFVRENWRFEMAMAAVVGFWSSPDYRYLTSRDETEEETTEPEEPALWLTQIIEKLSRDRGWTTGEILGLPYLGVLKLLAQIEERTWDERNEMIITMERAVARAIAGALGKGDALPALPSYREVKRRLGEVEEIKRKGRRFFDAAMR